MPSSFVETTPLFVTVSLTFENTLGSDSWDDGESDKVAKFRISLISSASDGADISDDDGDTNEQQVGMTGVHIGGRDSGRFSYQVVVKY